MREVMRSKNSEIDVIALIYMIRILYIYIYIYVSYVCTYVYDVYIICI